MSIGLPLKSFNAGCVATCCIINIAKKIAINLINKSAYVLPTLDNHFLNIPSPLIGSMYEIIGIGAINLKKYNFIILTATSIQKLSNTSAANAPHIVDIINL